ncbi:unnamed protein product [Parnassius apollo]|uniref:(apollo) hypothetical protein n=1 Tax=Parnassius apollo TaxID=110799 RepID=A0A8S3YF24_PARAO|nr:unnamed protein product [Parnassius apollo]
MKVFLLSRGVFDIEKLRLRLEELDSQASNDNLWQDNQKAQEILKERSKINNDVELFLKLERDYNDAISLMKSAIDENDEEFFSEVESELAKLEQLIQLKETESLFTRKADNNNCFLEIHSGDGGTESNDWAEMLMRMYVRWAEIYHNFKVEVVEKLGESVGIKSAMIFNHYLFNHHVGEKAYGWAKSESGIHRLVRISPFDANGRRHTSFASVGVTPVTEDSIDIAVDEKDLKIDTYRASGAGGQHVNKTESAVRITHIPIGVVVQCQNGRSQHRNKEEALKLLKGQVEEVDFNAADENGKISLHRSALSGHKEVVNILIGAGANVKVVNNNGETPLHFAAVTYNEEVIKALVKGGADVNAVNKDCETPLHFAGMGCLNEHSFTILIINGADVNLADKNGRTPLHAAALGDFNARVIDVLIENGVVPSLKDKDRKTSMNLDKYRYIKQILEKKAIKTVLLPVVQLHY